MRILYKGLFITIWFVASYCAALVGGNTCELVIACLSLAIAAAALGFNVFHDATHFAFVANRQANVFLGATMCAMLGPSRVLWHWKHQIYHHVFINIYGWDDDLETRGHLRLSTRQPWLPKYRYQHFLFPLFYALSTVEWVFVKDFVQYATARMTHRSIRPLTVNESIEFWLCKAVYIGLFVVLPFAFHPPLYVLSGFLIFHLVFGLTLALIFQLAHSSTDVEFPEPTRGDPARIAEEWALHVLRTTVNFGTRNAILTWFAGGLNFQIEHHLFPNIAHTHYPALARIVRATAAEHGFPYKEYSAYRQAVVSHCRLLRILGSKPVLHDQHGHALPDLPTADIALQAE